MPVLMTTKSTSSDKGFKNKVTPTFRTFEILYWNILDLEKIENQRKFITSSARAIHFQTAIFRRVESTIRLKNIDS